MKDLLHGTISISERAHKQLRRGHLWIYKDELSEAPSLPGIVQVKDSKGKSLGYALASPGSQIALRMLSKTEPSVDLIRERIEQANARRQRYYPDRTTYRMVHGEADLLPGIFIDRYGDVLVLQQTCGGADSIGDILLNALTDLFGSDIRAIVRRNDAKSRRHEKLRMFTDVPVGDGFDGNITYAEGDVHYDINLIDDQKTGSFLDQVDNHLGVRRYARGEVLDGCTYHGGFALQMARNQQVERVTAVDSSSKALESAQAAANKNGLSQKVRFVCEDVFDALERFAERGRTFDTIVIDPPAFAASRDTVEKAIAAYARLNQLALERLAPGGTLVTCSCSGRVDGKTFEATVVRAAWRSKRPVHILERWGAGLDHPVLAGMPETEYLKVRLLAAV